VGSQECFGGEDVCARAIVDVYPVVHEVVGADLEPCFGRVDKGEHGEHGEAIAGIVDSGDAESGYGSHLGCWLRG
jgi:hypothetical protein